MQKHDTQSLEQRLVALCERIAAARNLAEVNIAAGETLNELRGSDESWTTPATEPLGPSQWRA